MIGFPFVEFEFDVSLVTPVPQLVTIFEGLLGFLGSSELVDGAGVTTITGTTSSIFASDWKEGSFLVTLKQLIQ